MTISKVADLFLLISLAANLTWLWLKIEKLKKQVEENEQIMRQIGTEVLIHKLKLHMSERTGDNDSFL